LQGFDILADKPRVTVLNKIDAIDEETLAERKAELEEASGGRVMLMSGVSKKGVPDVLRALWAEIAKDKPKPEDDGGAWQP